MRALLTTMLLAVAGFPAAPGLAGQSLADRIATVRDGTVRLSYATRPNVCGNGEFIGFDLPDAFYAYSSWSNGYSVNVMHDVLPDCEGGPFRLVVVKTGGRVAELRAAVGVRWRASGSAVDLGVVSAPAAAAWLMGVAEADDDEVARTALLAAAAADSARITDRVLALARDRARPAAVRQRAIRWATVVGGAEGRSDDVDRALRAIAADADESMGVRERAIRDLRGTPENRAYLRSLYGSVEDITLRERILREIASDGSADDAAWVRSVALETSEPAALRERAIRVLGEELNRPGEVRTLFARLDDRVLRERALRVAVEQGGSAELAWAREVTEDRQEDATVRARAIRLLAERGDVAYLRQVYPRLDRLDLKEQALRTVAQRNDAEAAAWLAEIVLNDAEQVGLRDRAVRSLAEAGAPSRQLATLYDRVTSSAVKQRLIRLLAERRDDVAATKLAAIAADDSDAALRREAERRKK